MRKEILLPEQLLANLKQLAFDSDMTVKKFMERIVVNYIINNTKKKSAPEI